VITALTCVLAVAVAGPEQVAQAETLISQLELPQQSALATLLSYYTNNLSFGQRNFLRSYMHCSFTSNARCTTFLNMVDMIYPQLKSHAAPLMNVPAARRKSLFTSVASLSDVEVRRVVANIQSHTSTTISGLL
jgi:hypothetical protein